MKLQEIEGGQSNLNITGQSARMKTGRDAGLLLLAHKELKPALAILIQA